jgi:hypothetical protein
MRCLLLQQMLCILHLRECDGWMAIYETTLTIHHTDT